MNKNQITKNKKNLHYGGKGLILQLLMTYIDKIKK